MITAKAIPAFDTTRLWNRVDKSGDINACWPWTGSRNSQGYGRITIKGGTFSCHRVALHLTAPPSSEYLYACHVCDNPPCCNPNHLYWGSAKNNISDRDTRGRRRGPVGVTHHKAKLDPKKVREIRRLADTMTQRKLAAKFGVAQGVIWNIIHKKFWKEVED